MMLKFNPMPFFEFLCVEQNFFGSLGGISEGTLYYPLGQADGKLPHVDLQDVGKVRTRRAKAHSFFELGHFGADAESHCC
jgi:hypothetical protein